MAGDLAPLPEEHRDLEGVKAFQLRIVADIPLHEIQTQARKSALEHLPHVTAQGAVGLAEEDQRQSRGSGVRRRVAIPATAIATAIESCTTRPLRSG